MWIIHFLPESWLVAITTAMIVVGLASYAIATFIKRFPYINIYRVPLQIAAVIVFVLGVYWRGGLAIEQEWRERVREMEARVAEAEKKSARVNTVIKRVYVDRVKKIKQDVVVYRDRIKEVEKVIDRDCRVPAEAIRILNDAARTPRATVETGPLIREDK